MGYKQNDILENKLCALHHDSKKDFLRVAKVAAKSMLRSMKPVDFEFAYLPVSKSQGEFMRQLVIENNCKHIVEFGTSFGISTIYLADAARQTDGKVITTEILKSKAAIAKQNIMEAGVGEFVEIMVGDAMETLRNHPSQIDFLLLDGWKDLYLPLFRLLEPQFHAGTLIYSDNMDMADTKGLADYLFRNKHIYSTQSIDSGKAFLTKLL